MDLSPQEALKLLEPLSQENVYERVRTKNEKAGSRVADWGGVASGPETESDTATDRRGGGARERTGDADTGGNQPQGMGGISGEGKPGRGSGRDSKPGADGVTGGPGKTQGDVGGTRSVDNRGLKKKLTATAQILHLVFGVATLDIECIRPSILRFWLGIGGYLRTSTQMRWNLFLNFSDIAFGDSDPVGNLPKRGFAPFFVGYSTTG
ncbi:MAG: hypothetical protein KAS75_04680 [Planctomycetes bacterium]|nr:hypothetical protein [Planctomycetota bacterium]